METQFFKEKLGSCATSADELLGGILSTDIIQYLNGKGFSRLLDEATPPSITSMGDLS